MPMRSMTGIALVSILLMAQAGAALAQDDRLQKIEQRVSALEKRVADKGGSLGWIKDYAPATPILGIGLFCGLWARSTGRDFWLWFVGGMLFNVLALIYLYCAIGDDKAAKRRAAEKASKELLDV
jgi:hypothetical protein